MKSILNLQKMNLCVFIALFASITQALELKPYQLDYEATWNGIPVFGSATRKLTKNGDETYHIYQYASAIVGSYEEQSTFLWHDHKAYSKEYENIRNGFGNKKKDQSTIDWDKKHIFSKSTDKEKQLDFTGMLFDRMTFQIQMRYDLAKNGAQANSEKFSYDITEKGKIHTYDFKIVAQEKLDTPIGMFNTIKIEKVRVNDNKRKTYIWLAVDWDYLPIRIIQKEGSSDYELMIKSGKLDQLELKGS